MLLEFWVLKEVRLILEREHLESYRGNLEYMLKQYNALGFKGYVEGDNLFP